MASRAAAPLGPSIRPWVRRRALGGARTIRSPPMSPRVIVIGGGYSGAMCAAHLVRHGCAVTVIEPRDRLGVGVAYGTSERGHLLNVVAGRMSAFTDRPDDFVEWASGSLGRSVSPDAFLPRRIYGEYVAHRVEEARRRAGAAFEHVRARAVEIAWHSGRLFVRMGAGEVVEGGACVVACGHGSPADPPVRFGAELYASGRYIRDPWRPDAFDGIGANEGVLVIGTGLTMIDMVIGLRARGHRGVVTAISRRGLTPRAHASAPTRPGGPCIVAGMGVRASVRALRSASEALGWREAVDSVRPMIPEIWRAWSESDRRRFLHRARPYWDVHRHRCAPSVGAMLDAERAAGGVRILSGRLAGWRVESDGVVAVVAGRGTDEMEEALGARVINCTGPCNDPRRSADPLVRRMLAGGLCRADAHGLGVETDARGRVTGDGGAPLWCVGSWRAAQAWESVAVPELRAQAEAVAADVAREIGGA